MKVILLFVFCLFLSHKIVAKFVDGLIDKSDWFKVRNANKQTNSQQNNSCSALTNCWATNNNTKAGETWEDSSDTVKYTPACQNNTGSNDPKFREVDHDVEYHTRKPTEVGNSDNCR